MLKSTKPLKIVSRCGANDCQWYNYSSLSRVQLLISLLMAEWIFSVANHYKVDISVFSKVS